MNLYNFDVGDFFYDIDGTQYMVLERTLDGDSILAQNLATGLEDIVFAEEINGL